MRSLGFDSRISSPLRLDFQVSKEMTDSTSNKGTWGAFTPVMPAFVRLVAGVIVLVILEAVILGFPGIGYNITGTQLSVANIAVFMIGLIVCFIVLKFGTQLANAASDAYKSYRTWTPLLPDSGNRNPLRCDEPNRSTILHQPAMGLPVDLPIDRADSNAEGRCQRRPRTR